MSDIILFEEDVYLSCIQGICVEEAPDRLPGIIYFDYHRSSIGDICKFSDIEEKTIFVANWEMGLRFDESYRLYSMHNKREDFYPFVQNVLSKEPNFLKFYPTNAIVLKVVILLHKDIIIHDFGNWLITDYLLFSKDNISPI